MLDIPAQIKELVEEMLKLYKELKTVKTSSDKIEIRRQMTEIDKKLGNLVYKLYELTDDEIEIVKKRDGKYFRQKISLNE